MRFGLEEGDKGDVYEEAELRLDQEGASIAKQKKTLSLMTRPSCSEGD